MTEGEENMARIHLECGRRIYELEKALTDATNFLAHMHNSRLETEGLPCMNETGIGWCEQWQSLIQNDLQQKQIIKPKRR